MTRDEFARLFEMQVRGHLAAAFIFSRTPPGEYWPYLHGEKEITMRIMGEIMDLTGYNLNMQLFDRPKNSEAAE